MASSASRRLGGIAALLLMLASLVACGGDPTTVFTTAPAGTPAPGTTPGTDTTPSTGPTTAPPTPTNPPVATCAGLLPGAGAASAGGLFSDLPFPAGSVGTGQTVVHSGTGIYTISTFSVCSSGTSAAAIKAYYTSNLVSGGWSPYPTLPFDGAYPQPCGDPYCWEKGPNPSAGRLIGLESVADRGNNVVTYQWRIFAPPPSGVCNAADMTGGVASGNGGPSGYNFPPVTSYNDLGGAAGTYLKRMCSSGDPTTIAAFMKRSVADAGWQVLSSSTTTVHAQKPQSGGFCYTLDVTTGTHGSYTGEWDFATHSPAAMCV